MSSPVISPIAEEDIPTFVRVELEAFKSHPRTPMIWQNGYTSQLYRYYQNSKSKALHDDPESRFMKAVDLASGQIIGVSQWTFALDAAKNACEPSPSLTERPPADWPEGGNWEMRRWFKRNTHEMVQEFLDGQAYIMLDILTINPESQARGVGTRLLCWGVQQADEIGVAMCLESTPAGLALYQKLGFKPVRYVRADMKKFGWNLPYDEDAVQRVFMIREAKSNIS